MSAPTWHSRGRFVNLWPADEARPPRARSVSCHDDAEAARIARLPVLEALVRELVEALRAHVAEEAKRAGVAPEVVCPCRDDVLRRAEEALSSRTVLRVGVGGRS